MKTVTRPVGRIALRAFFAASVSASVLGGLAHAQPASPDNTKSTEIVVTGSRIARDPSDTTIPLTEIGQEEFQTRGFENAINALLDVPLVGSNSNTSRGNSTQFGDNNAFVDLLNLGSQRTLTLIDGHRFVSSNQGTVFVPGNQTGSQVDLTIVNPLLIKRTEVQTVGTGPIYGADAVSGVVNIIIDRDFNGFKSFAQGGITQRGDGGNFDLGAAYGTDLFKGRGHIVFGGEYLNQDGIIGGPNPARRGVNNQFATVNNPVSFSASDNIPDLLRQAGTNALQIPTAGLLVGRQVNTAFPTSFAAGSSGSTAQLFFPTRASDSANDTAFNAFRAATGLTPFNYALANPTLNGINPLLFVGTFGIPSQFPSVPNTDPATLALGLTRLAVPTTFDANGNPVPYNIGQILPPGVANQSLTIGNGGFQGSQFNNFLANQKRYSFNSAWKFDVSPAVEYRGDFLFSRISNTNVSDNQGSQTPGCAATSGNCGVPIYYNQNPFVTPATLSFINNINTLNAGGNSIFRPQTIGGQPFLSLTRALDDITGRFNNTEGNLSQTFGTTQEFLGSFTALGGRKFDWDITGRYTRNTSKNRGATDIRDIEFALASDVVVGPNGRPVCYQQTLAAPESVAVRNPRLTNININTPGGLVPTAAQVAACQPLNLFGTGNASQAAIDYVTGHADATNRDRQIYLSGSLTGEIADLPGGKLKFNSELEYRREALTFSPNDFFEFGLGRTTIGQPSDGIQRFIEGGTEFLAPLLNGDEGLPFFKVLELDGAVRVVNRIGSGTPNGLANPRVNVASSTAVTFTAGGRWSPFEGFTFRGNRTRAVRSPSIVEALGAPQTGFSNLASAFPCNAFNRNNGPSSGIRIANCDAFEASLGLPAGTFAGLTPPNSAVAAGVGGNPNLVNEVANNWQFGAVWKPTFLPHLTIEADWFSVRIDGVINLSFLGTQCFDQPEFPNTVIGGVPVCDAINLAVADPNDPTRFITPAVNVITGNPLAPPAIVGSLAPVQAPFTIASAQFSNVNQGSNRLRGLNAKISYDFRISDLTSHFAPKLPDLGKVYLAGNVYYVDRFETSDSGTFDGDIGTIDGSPGNPHFRTRLDVGYQNGKFSQLVQWFRDGNTVVNPDSTQPLDQAVDFFVPSYNTFSYNVSYKVNDHFTVRGIVDNLTDARNQPEFGSRNIGDLVGRRFTLRIDSAF